MDTTAELLLSLVPADGASIGNIRLSKLFLHRAAELGMPVTPELFEQTRNELVRQGYLVRGRGRGGSVRRAEGRAEAFRLEEQEKPEPRKKRARRKRAKKKTAGRRPSGEAEIASYRHQDKRANNPPVGMVTPDTDRVEAPKEWRYDPHIAPELQFDVTRSQVEKLIDDALASGSEETMRRALAELRRMSGPFLNWTGKAERTSFEVDTVSLHVHERIDPATVLANIRKRLDASSSSSGGNAAGYQLDLFSPPFENLPLREAIEFYKHEKGWSNRLVAGDSLLVMNSLLQKEGMAGRVQMIYIDPPYGIRYGSNFQPFVNKRDVKDRKDEDLTQEPEMIKAFRDTWELGIHSYLTYLRDRLLLARELLAETGSVFVQISDENLHHVRELMDEVFCSENFIAIITFQKTGSQAGSFLGTTLDYLAWYAKSKALMKYRQLYVKRVAGSPSLDRYDQIELGSGSVRRLKADEKRNAETIPIGERFRPASLFSDGASKSGSFDYQFRGKVYPCAKNSHWKTGKEGLDRLTVQGRIVVEGSRIRYKRYVDDFPVHASPVDRTNYYILCLASQ